MSDDKRTLVAPIMLLTVGAGWLLTTMGVAPGIDWVWSLGLAVTGVLTVVLCGWDKFTAVVGPFFIVCSLLSVLRQLGKVSLDHEMPVLVIVLGLLWLIARAPSIPVPRWYHQEPPPSQG